MKPKQKIPFNPVCSKILLLLLVYTYPTLYAQPSMVPVIGGTFIMGCTIEQEAECSDSEKPAHEVSLQSFEIGRYEVTHAEWLDLMSDVNPVGTPYFANCGVNCPIEKVSWYDAAVYCNRLSEQYGYTPCYYADAGFTQIYGKNGNIWSLPNTGTVYWRTDANGYRLPTEAEWEYAARGGLQSEGYKYAGSNIIDEVVWYWGNSTVSYTPNYSGHGAHPVGTKAANELGLFDMTGNIAEWCWDLYNDYYYTSSANCSPLGPSIGSDRSVRGNGWWFQAPDVRTSARNVGIVNFRYTVVGFRIARTTDVTGCNLGTPCDDGNPNTYNDLVQVNCICAGTFYDCPILNLNIGDTCSDSNPNTNNDVVQANCTCAGTLPVTSTPEMVFVGGGSFTMGCTSEQEPNCFIEEYPQHTVTVPDFELGKYEVDQEQWLAVMSDINPTGTPNFIACGGNCPVEKVSWFDAVVYCNRLSELNGYTPCYYSDLSFTQVYGKNGNLWSLPNSGLVYWNTSASGYRLSTEAEWEYAARGGMLSQGYKYAGSNTASSVAWYSSNSTVAYTPNWDGSGTHPVGLKLPNELGLFDMSGNVYEWCYDWYSITYYSSLQNNNPIGPETGIGRVMRSGSWYDIDVGVRVAHRNYPLPESRYFNMGFRIARTP